MNFMTHMVMGLVIGKITGNYFYALMGATIVDIDHVFAYWRHSMLRDPKKIFDSMFDAKDDTGDQRGILHNILICALISSGIYYYAELDVFIAFSLGYLSHLVLDLLDSSDYYPLYPVDYKIAGPIEYLSRYEFLFGSMLLFVYVGLLLFPYNL